KLHLQTDVSDIGHPELIETAQRQGAGQVGIHRQAVPGVGRHHELPPPQAQQIVLAHQTVDPFVIHRPAPPPQLRRHPRPPVTGKLQRNPLDGVTEFHVPIRPRRVGGKAIKPRPAHPRPCAHPLHRQGYASRPLGLDLLVDSGFPPVPAVSAARRCAASTPSKNQSPALAGQSCAPVARPGPPPSAVSPGPETHCRALGETPAASGGARWGSLQTLAPPPRATPPSPTAGSLPA